MFNGGQAFEVFRRSLLNDYSKTFTALSSDEKADFSPPSDAAIRRAWELYCLSHARQFPPQMVVPSAEGGVGICFSQAGKYADLECLNSNEVLGVVSDRHGCIEVFEVNFTSITDVEDAISKISQFLASPENALPHTVAVCC